MPMNNIIISVLLQNASKCNKCLVWFIQVSRKWPSVTSCVLGSHGRKTNSASWTHLVGLKISGSWRMKTGQSGTTSLMAVNAGWLAASDKIWEHNWGQVFYRVPHADDVLFLPEHGYTLNIFSWVYSFNFPNRKRKKAMLDKSNIKYLLFNVQLLVAVGVGVGSKDREGGEMVTGFVCGDTFLWQARALDVSSRSKPWPDRAAASRPPPYFPLIFPLFSRLTKVHIL